MVYRRFFYPLLGISLFCIPQRVNFAQDNPQKGAQVITIPVEVTSKVFYPKPKERVPNKLPVEVNPKIDANKVALVYPREIYKPQEKVKVESSFFSCGQTDAKTLYAEGVKAFQKGDYQKAKAYFLRLINEYPQSPYAIKARYYLGYISFVKGKYRQAYETFKNLCNLPYNFVWKTYTCYNTVISGLYIGIHDKKAAATSDFWRNYLNWLEGNISDEQFYRSLHCENVAQPYRTYCFYLKQYLNPSDTVAQLPPYYKRSLEIRKLVLKFLSGSFVNAESPLLGRLLNDPKYGEDLQYYYTLYLINNGNYDRALNLIETLKRKNPQKALELAKILASVSPQYAYQLLRLFPNSTELWEIYLKELYNLKNYTAVVQYAPSLGLYRLAGYAAYNLGRYDLAAQYLSKIRNKNLEDYRLLFDSLLRLKKWNQYLTYLNEIKNKYPNLYKEFLGWYYYYEGKWLKAVSLLREPLYRAAAYFNVGYYDKALSLLKNLPSTEAKILEAKIYLAKGQFNRAINVLSGIETSDAIYLKGLAYFAQGKYREAAFYFSKLLNQIGNYPDALLKLADSYYNLGRYDYAKHYYLEFIRLFPNSSLVNNAYLGLANIYLQNGDLQIANLLYKVVKKNPTVGGDELKLKLAEGFIKAGDLKKAKELLENLLKSNNDFYRGKALILLSQIESNKKLQYLQEALKISLPQIRSEAAIELVEYYLSKGDKRKALETLERYEKDINNPQKLIELYTKLEAFDRLYYLLKELIAADNKYTADAYKIAKKYHRIEFYKLSIYSLDPKIASDSAYQLEKFYLMRGNLKEALKYVLYLKMKNLKYEPTYSQAMFLAVKTLTDKGYIKDACSLIEEINSNYLNTDQKLELESIKVTCQH